MFHYQPMFCAKENMRLRMEHIRYPIYASPKYDGMRCLITPRGPKTRSMKPLANRHAREMLQKLPVGLDGELAVIVNGNVNFRETQSLLRRYDGEPQFLYFIFDYVSDFTNYGYCKQNFVDRLTVIELMFEQNLLPNWCVQVQHVHIGTVELLQTYYAAQIANGLEGVCIRKPRGWYKFGRASNKGQELMRIKERETDEALVVGVAEEMENCNEQVTSELGLSRRSSKNEALIGKGSLGALICSSAKFPKTFKIGTGFSAQDRADLWHNSPVGKIAHYSYDPTGGYTDAPRQAVFIGFREKEDL